MSSRNKYLTPAQRNEATVLYQSLKKAAGEIEKGEKDPEMLKNTIRQEVLAAREARLEYVEIVDVSELRPVSTVADSCLIAVAVKFGLTRLIDNIVVGV